MGAVVAGIEFDAKAGPVFVGGIEFDTVAAPVIVGWIEFDCLAPARAGVVGGSARRATTTTVGIKSSPPAPSVRYHGRAYEQEELAAAAELDDEETILAFLMEIALT